MTQAQLRALPVLVAAQNLAEAARKGAGPTPAGVVAEILYDGLRELLENLDRQLPRLATRAP